MVAPKPEAALGLIQIALAAAGTNGVGKLTLIANGLVVVAFVPIWNL